MMKTAVKFVDGTEEVYFGEYSSVFVDKGCLFISRGETVFRTTTIPLTAIKQWTRDKFEATTNRRGENRC